jgi:hypothetical protein
MHIMPLPSKTERAKGSVVRTLIFMNIHLIVIRFISSIVGLIENKCIREGVSPVFALALLGGHQIFLCLAALGFANRERRSHTRAKHGERRLELAAWHLKWCGGRDRESAEGACRFQVAASIAATPSPQNYAHR